MTITPEKLAANRRNAQQSTGPKTANGKAASKLNALKHGLLAQTVLVRGERYHESPVQFKRLCHEFYATLAPVGPLEETLVDQMIQASWRLRRARRAEAGEVAVSVDEGSWERRRVNPELQSVLWHCGGDPVWAMGKSAIGNSLLARWLREVRARVEMEGELSEAAVKIPFHGQPNQLSRELEKLRQQFQPPGGAGGGAGGEETKQKLLTQIDRKLSMLEWSKAGCQQHETTLEEARQSAAVLPAEATLAKILRYETALERQLYRAMNALERLQRRRCGEDIPAPLTVDVSPKA